MGKDGNLFSNLGKNNKYIDERTAQTAIFPRLGAFEIQVDGILIYSKILSSAWPNYDYIVEKIEQIKKEKENGQNLSEHEIRKNASDK